MLQDIKILAIRQKCAANTMLEEAMRDLLAKYKDKASRQGYSQQNNTEVALAVHEEGGEYKKGI